MTSIKRVFDEPNPFGPDLKRGRYKLTEQPQIKKFQKRFNALDAYERHKQLINNYKLYYPGSTATFQRDTSKDKGVYDILKEQHRFLWGTDDLSEADKSWDMQLAKKYYDKLFKEYCIADLRYYDKNRIGLRWRTEPEVMSGKGQFICGGKHCDIRKKLTSWEVNFSYAEQGQHKNALVKVRLCKECSLKLNYHSQKRKIKKEIRKEKHSKKHKKKHKKKRRNRSGSSSSSSSSSESDSDEEGAQSSSAVVKTEAPDQNEAEDKAKKASEEAAEIWSKPPDVQEELQPEDEMDAFLDDLLM